MRPWAQVGDSPLWAATVDAAVACAFRAEATLLDALRTFLAPGGGGLARCEAVGGARCGEAARLLASPPRWALLADRPDVVAAVTSQVPGGRALALPDHVRVHSGLRAGARTQRAHRQKGLLFLVVLRGAVRSLLRCCFVRRRRGAGGSADRVMGTALGPLQDLLVASDALAMVGSAGSSFSDVLASLLAVDAPGHEADGGDAKVLIRTPFVKSSQVQTTL